MIKVATSERVWSLLDFGVSELLCPGAGAVTAGKFGSRQPRNVGKSPFAGAYEGDQRWGGVIKVATHDKSEMCFLSWAWAHTSPSRCLLSSNRSVALWGDVSISHLWNQCVASLGCLRWELKTCFKKMIAVCWALVVLCTALPVWIYQVGTASAGMWLRWRCWCHPFCHASQWCCVTGLNLTEVPYAASPFPLSLFLEEWPGIPHCIPSWRQRAFRLAEVMCSTVSVTWAGGIFCLRSCW